MVSATRLRFGCLVIVALILSGLLPVRSWADLEVLDGEFTIGAWNGAAFADENGVFTDCWMSAEFKNRITLGFSIDADGYMMIMLQNADWQLGNEKEYDITVRLDSRAARDVVGRGTDNFLWIHVGEDATFFDNLSYATTLIVESQGQDFSFDIEADGASAAKKQLYYCAERHAAKGSDNPFAAPGSSGESNPFDEQDTNQSADSNPFGEKQDQNTSPSDDTDQAMEELVVVMLQEAGLPSPEVHKSKDEFDGLIWNSKDKAIDVYGLVGFYNPVANPSAFLAEFAQGLIADCGPSSNLQIDNPRVTNDSIVVNARASCRVDNGALLATYISFIQLDSGALMFIVFSDQDSENLAYQLITNIRDSWIAVQ